MTKAKRRAPTGSPLVGVRIPPHLLDKLDEWIAEQPEPRPTRPGAVRQLMEQVLVAEPRRKAG